MRLAYLPWAVQSYLDLLYQHFSGISGLIIIFSCLVICLPMTIFKNRIRYEMRKNPHCLFIVFAMTLCFHTTRLAVRNGGFSSYVFGTVVNWYFLDSASCFFFMTEKTNTTKFSVVPPGVRMTMTVSERF
jgi:hypothetical protein